MSDSRNRPSICQRGSNKERPNVVSAEAWLGSNVEQTAAHVTKRRVRERTKSIGERACWAVMVLPVLAILSFSTMKSDTSFAQDAAPSENTEQNVEIPGSINDGLKEQIEQFFVKFDQHVSDAQELAKRYKATPPSGSDATSLIEQLNGKAVEFSQELLRDGGIIDQIEADRNDLAKEQRSIDALTNKSVRERLSGELRLALRQSNGLVENFRLLADRFRDEWNFTIEQREIFRISFRIAGTRKRNELAVDLLEKVEQTYREYRTFYNDFGGGLADSSKDL